MAQLTIVQADMENNYSKIKRIAVEDKRLSFKAKGLHTYLVTRPPNWQVLYKSLEKISCGGRASLKTAVTELETFGYLTILQDRVEGGRFGDYIWSVYSHPRDDSNGSKESQQRVSPKVDIRYQVSPPNVDIPHVDKPHADIPDTENQHHNKTKGSNKTINDN